MNKDTGMYRNSVGQVHSSCLNGTVTFKSCEANANYLQSRLCEAKTKEVCLPWILLTQESSVWPVNIQANKKLVSVCGCERVLECVHIPAWFSVEGE